MSNMKSHYNYIKCVYSTIPQKSFQSRSEARVTYNVIGKKIKQNLKQAASLGILYDVDRTGGQNEAQRKTKTEKQSTTQQNIAAEPHTTSDVIGSSNTTVHVIVMKQRSSYSIQAPVNRIQYPRDDVIHLHWLPNSSTIDTAMW